MNERGDTVAKVLTREDVPVHHHHSSIINSGHVSSFNVPAQVYSSKCLLKSNLLVTLPEGIRAHRILSTISVVDTTTLSSLKHSLTHPPR